MSTLTATGRKSLTFDAIIKAADAASGVIEGIANVGNVVDLQGDRLEPGAWAKVLREKQAPPFVWGHNVEQVDVRGRVTYLAELPPGDRRIAINANGGNASGLFFRAQMAMKSTVGKDAYELMAGGFVKEVSVQFFNRREDEEIDRQGVRHIKLIDTLLEISAVIKAASPGSQVLLAKRLARLQSTSSLAALVGKAAEDAEDRTWLALQEAERRAAEARHRKEAVREGMEVAAKSIRQSLARAKEIQEIERMTNQSGNYFQAPPPRQLTAEEARIAEIRRMAGHI